MGRAERMCVRNQPAADLAVRWQGGSGLCSTPDATPEGSATLQGSESGAPGAKVPKGEKLQPGSK